MWRRRSERFVRKMSRPAALAYVARGGALNKLSPALAGKTDVASVVAAGGGHYKVLQQLRFCSDRLRARAFRTTSEPRAERGAKIVERAFARD
jgi:hypothetical protein